MDVRCVCAWMDSCMHVCGMYVGVYFDVYVQFFNDLKSQIMDKIVLEMTLLAVELSWNVLDIFFVCPMSWNVMEFGFKKRVATMSQQKWMSEF